jgi:hypothetical protein
MRDAFPGRRQGGDDSVDWLNCCEYNKRFCVRTCDSALMVGFYILLLTVRRGK